MPSITFDLETVTPLFLAGANQQEAELPPPAFRGALRYWFRAIAASITTFDEVKKGENKVFGNNDAGGTVIIRVQAQKAVSTRILTRDDNFPGLVYLFFSTYRDNRREAIGCVPPGSHFKIILQTRPLIKEDLDCLKLAVEAMWMLVNLGGIGSRSNRGGGNLKVKKEPENTRIQKLQFIINATDINQLSSKIAAGIKTIKQVYTDVLKSEPYTPTLPIQFDTLNSNTASVYLWQSQDSEDNDYWDNILDSFGKHYNKFRLRYQNATQDDYTEIKEWLRTGETVSLLY